LDVRGLTRTYVVTPEGGKGQDQHTHTLTRSIIVCTPALAVWLLTNWYLQVPVIAPGACSMHHMACNVAPVI
jgi:hypothetical protein